MEQKLSGTEKQTEFIDVITRHAERLSLLTRISKNMTADKVPQKANQSVSNGGHSLSRACVAVTQHICMLLIVQF